jgi:pimeloyl-ACP methyl ester carboxylesterase
MSTKASAMPSIPRLTIVAVHGNGGGAFRFARVVPFIPEPVRLRPVTLPGFAAVPPDPALRSVRDFARCLGEMTAAEPRPRVLLGHGIGGSIALQLANDAPDLLDGLVLHAPVGVRLDRRRLPRLMSLPGARRVAQSLIASSVTRPLITRLLFSRPVPSAYLRRFFAAYRDCHVFGQMYDIITPAWFAALRPVALPAALLWGGRERILAADHARDYGALLPDCTVRIVPEWDHFPMIEQPRDYARVVIELARALVAR